MRSLPDPASEPLRGSDSRPATAPRDRAPALLGEHVRKVRGARRLGAGRQIGKEDIESERALIGALIGSRTALGLSLNCASTLLWLFFGCPWTVLRRSGTEGRRRRRRRRRRPRHLASISDEGRPRLILRNFGRAAENACGEIEGSLENAVRRRAEETKARDR